MDKKAFNLRGQYECPLKTSQEAKMAVLQREKIRDYIR